MKDRAGLFVLMAMVALSPSMGAAPSADEILKEATAKAGSEGKTIFLVFDSPG